MIAHFALALLLPAAWLTRRWSRLVSGALWLTLATWLAYEAAKWQWPAVWSAGHLEWMRGVSMATGLVGACELRRRQIGRGLRGEELMVPAAYALATGRASSPEHAIAITRELQDRLFGLGRPDILAALLVASMGVDLTAWLIHRGAGQWGPQPFFQVGVLLAMCAVSVWPRRK